MFGIKKLFECRKHTKTNIYVKKIITLFMIWDIDIFTTSKMLEQFYRIPMLYVVSRLHFFYLALVLKKMKKSNSV